MRMCPCQSGLSYRQCCQPWHEGAWPATAEATMRSRYSAWALGLHTHLNRTWHPRTRPVDLGDDPGVVWTGLEIVAAEAGGPDDDTGTVEFIAAWEDDGRAGRQHEVSLFERRAGHWVYVQPLD